MNELKELTAEFEVCQNIMSTARDEAKRLDRVIDSATRERDGLLLRFMQYANRATIVEREIRRLNAALPLGVLDV